MSLLEIEHVHAASVYEKERLFNEDGERDMAPNMAIGFESMDGMLFPPISELAPVLNVLGITSSLGMIAAGCIDAALCEPGREFFKIEEGEVPTKVYFTSDGYTRTVDANIPDEVPPAQTLAEAFAMRPTPEPIDIDMAKDFAENPFTDVKECITTVVFLDDLVGDYEVWSISQAYIIGEHGVFAWDDPVVAEPGGYCEMGGAIVENILDRLRYFKKGGK